MSQNLAYRAGRRVAGNLHTSTFVVFTQRQGVLMVGTKLDRTHVPEPLHTLLVGLKTFLQGRAACRQTDTHEEITF